MGIRFTVWGRPVGKSRPRFRRAGAYVQTYTPATTRAYEESVRAAYAEASGQTPPCKGPVSIDIAIFVGVPQRTSRADRAQMLAWRIRPTSKPDIDNICKVIMDGLIGCAYDDDRQVADLTVRRYYTDAPRVEVCIDEIS